MKNLFIIILLLSAGYSQNNIECWGHMPSIYDMTGDSLNGIFTSIDADVGGFHRFCAINESGGIECWGNLEAWPSSGTYYWDIPDGVFIDVTLGGNFMCAINESGFIDCYGQGPTWGGYEVFNEHPTDNGYIKLAAGTGHVCALDESGCIECWGYNPSFGNHHTVGAHGQVPDAPEECIFTDIASGVGHTCAIKETGGVECWGYRTHTCNSQPCNSNTNEPPESFDKIYTAVTTAFWYGTCVIDQLGKLECWGSGTQVSNAPEDGSWVAIDKGAQYICAINESGNVNCWGYGPYGATGSGPQPNVYFDVVGNSYNTCALTCAEGLELDCAGDCGGSAVKDACGVCNGDNSYCSDCAGVINGDAVVDCCDECNGDNSSCGGSGDATGDDNTDITDVVFIIDSILTETELEGCSFNSSDVTGDGIINVLDVIVTIEIILGEGLARLDVPVPTSVELIQSANHLSYNADVDGLIGFELTLSHDDKIEFILTDKSIISDYQTSGNTTKMIIVTEVGNELFSSTGDFEIIDVIAGSAQSEIEYSISITPKEFGLSQAYPNPFNPVTNINFAVPESQDIILQVYNLQGQTIETLVNGNMEAGYHTLQWNADNYSSGIYFVRMIAGEHIDTQKLMLMK